MSIFLYQFMKMQKLRINDMSNINYMGCAQFCSGFLIVSSLFLILKIFGSEQNWLIWLYLMLGVVVGNQTLVPRDCRGGVLIPQGGVILDIVCRGVIFVAICDFKNDTKKIHTVSIPQKLEAHSLILSMVSAVVYLK